MTSGVENTFCMDKRQAILNSHVSKAQPFFFFCLSHPSKKGVYTTIKSNCTIYRGVIIALRKTREVTLDWFFCSPSHCECVSSVKTSSMPFSRGGISSGKPLWRAMEVDNWSGAGRSRKREAALIDDECRAFEPRRSSCARGRRGHHDGEIIQRWPPSCAGQCTPQCQHPVVLKECC